ADDDGGGSQRQRGTGEGPFGDDEPGGGAARGPLPTTGGGLTGAGAAAVGAAGDPGAEDVAPEHHEGADDEDPQQCQVAQAQQSDGQLGHGWVTRPSRRRRRS